MNLNEKKKHLNLSYEISKGGKAGIRAQSGNEVNSVKFPLEKASFNLSRRIGLSCINERLSHRENANGKSEFRLKDYLKFAL